MGGSSQGMGRWNGQDSEEQREDAASGGGRDDMEMCHNDMLDDSTWIWSMEETFMRCPVLVHT